MTIRNPALFALMSIFVLMVGLQATALADTIDVQDAYVRAVPPGQPNSAAFMRITNHGDEDRALLAGASDQAKVVELHTHRMEDGMMRMRQVGQIDLPAGETVVLEPGGLHVMLIGLTETLAPGNRVTLTLDFDDGDKQRLSLPVKRIEPNPMPMHQ
ncbi:copper chaperone PCu(A)C [Halochromatium sp.]|uniref:copper chaperone PCu(A)C n=1 Tax=Halochromatium sp. TaxID=2049430 RepID=UPI00397E266D